jgi:hypothetical protein
MIFDGKATSEITPSDIESLLRDRVEENAFLDYKARPYARDADGVPELVKDVSAFANAQGGYLVIGIGEEAGAPRRPGGLVNVEDAEGERRRIIDHCLEKIEPRLAELDIRSLVVDGKTLLVCRVPEGPQKPYCARPDREHHFFWRRYEDGNRLMSVPEIRECLEGDRVLRELAELRRELVHIRQQQVVAREAEEDINEDNAFQVQTVEAFHRFVDQQFVQATGGKPYYRLSATPLPINRISLQSHARQILALLERPPELRPHGWDMNVGFGHEARITSVGVVRNGMAYKHLRVLWNGHTEFWTEVDEFFFRFSEVPGGQVERKFLYPYAISEPVENFMLFVREICHLASFDGQVEFRLGFHRIHGFFLAPGHPQSRVYMWARADSGRPYGAQAFAEENLIVPPECIRVPDLPDQVTWRLVSQVYQRFGYPLDEQVPFFDAQHRFTLGQPQQQGGAP